MHPTDVINIINHLERAKGADRWIDAMIHMARFPEISQLPYVQHQIGRWTRMDGRPDIILAPEYTASLDAPLALAADILPSWSISMAFSEGYRHPVVTMGRSYPTNANSAISHHTMPLAMLLCIFTAYRQP